MILYAQRCQSLDLSTDPYEIEGIPRDVVKQWVVMTLGSFPKAVLTKAKPLRLRLCENCMKKLELQKVL